jgi:hypothetical protein
MQDHIEKLEEFITTAAQTIELLWKDTSDLLVQTSYSSGYEDDDLLETKPLRPPT